MPRSNVYMSVTSATATPVSVEPAGEERAIEAIQRGDRSAFAEWVRRHDRWVRSVAYAVLGRGEDLDDVSQQVWTSVWCRIGELRDVQRWRPWLFRLARNAALDVVRERTRRRTQLSHLPQRATETPDGAEPDAAMTAVERHREVLDAIAALPALYREPFVLRHLLGWSYRQIAEAMAMPVDSVETRLVRAMRQLRETLAECRE